MESWGNDCQAGQVGEGVAGERVAAAPWIRPAPWGTLGFVVPAAALPAAVSAALPAALALWTRPAELAGTRE